MTRVGIIRSEGQWQAVAVGDGDEAGIGEASPTKTEAVLYSLNRAVSHSGETTPVANPPACTVVRAPVEHASAARMLPIARVLLVSEDPADVHSLSRIMSHSKWSLRSCSTVKEAVAAIMENDIGVVICRRHLSDGTWTDLVEGIQSVLNAPKVLVASDQVTTALWHGALQAGADYVLRTPFDDREVFRNVSEAWQRWWYMRMRESKFDSATHRPRHDEARRPASEGLGPHLLARKQTA